MTKYVLRANDVIVGVFTWPQYDTEGNLITDPIPLEDTDPQILSFGAKDRLWDEIQRKRDFHNRGGIFASGHWFPSQPLDQQHWDVLLSLAKDVRESGGNLNDILLDSQDGTGQHVYYQTLDNGDVPMTANIIFTIANTGIKNANRNSQNAKRHKALMEASSTPWTYDYSDGWTEIYPGYVS